MDKLHKGKWRRGMVLSTPTTRRFSAAEWSRQNELEQTMIFTHFDDADQGRSRKRVLQLDSSHPNYEENAKFIIKAVNNFTALLAVARAHREMLIEQGYSLTEMEVCTVNEIIKNAEL